MSTERSAEDFFNMPPQKIDLSQAHSLRIVSGIDSGRAETTGNPHITQFRKVLEEVIGGLTVATQKALESQHHYFETVIKELQATVQAALNDIDGRLNLLSQAQGQTDEALDAFIKLWMLGNTEANLDDQKAIVANFLKRGLPVDVAPVPGRTDGLLYSTVDNDGNALPPPTRVLVETKGPFETYRDREPNDQNGQAPA